MSHAGPITAIAQLRAAPLAIPSSALGRRLWLIAAIASGLIVGLGLTLPFPARSLEPELARLLHGMVLIKGLIGLAVAGLVWWRLGRPVADGLAAGYAASMAISAAALGWLWGLHLIALGSVAFYAGFAGLVLLARRDPLLRSTPLPQSPRSASVTRSHGCRISVRCGGAVHANSGIPRRPTICLSARLPGADAPCGGDGGGAAAVFDCRQSRLSWAGRTRSCSGSRLGPPLDTSSLNYSLRTPKRTHKKSPRGGPLPGGFDRFDRSGRPRQPCCNRMRRSSTAVLAREM